MHRMSIGWAAAAVLALAGCSGAAPGADDAGESPSDEAPCWVGEWQLDVADYAVQAEAFLDGLGSFPLEDFAMTGEGAMTFTADNLVAGSVRLRTTGTFVVPEHSVPLDVTSGSEFSADWAEGADDATLDLAHWQNRPLSDLPAPVGPDGIEIPSPIDYADIPSVAIECSADSLRIQGPDAPLSALWHR